MNLKLTRRRNDRSARWRPRRRRPRRPVCRLVESDVHAAGLGRYAGPALPAKAKHVIMLFMNGGPSQLDMFDPKPALVKYAGQRPSAVDLRTERTTGGLLPSPFEFKRYGRNGVEVSELLPQLAVVIDDMCVIRSMYTFNPTHTPGAQPVAHRQRAGDAAVDGLVDLLRAGHREPEPAGVRRARPRGGRRTADRGRDSCRRVSGHRLQRLRSGSREDDPEPAEQDGRRGGTARRHGRAAAALNQSITRRRSATTSSSKAASSRWRRPIACSSRRWTLFDIRKEPQTHPRGVRHDAVRQRLPAGAPARRARRPLRPRRLPGGQTWDDHSDINNNLRKRCPDMDQAAAALIRDLKRRGLLDETLVVWGGEFGRTPVSESGNGPRPQPVRLHHVRRRRRLQGRPRLRRHRRVRLQGRAEPRLDPRPARDAAALARHRSHQADLPLRRPRLPADRRVTAKS